MGLTPVFFRRAAAREGIKGQDLPGGVLETAEVLPTAAGGVLLGAVEPEAFQDLALG